MTIQDEINAQTIKTVKQAQDFAIGTITAVADRVTPLLPKVDHFRSREPAEARRGRREGVRLQRACCWPAPRTSPSRPPRRSAPQAQARRQAGTPKACSQGRRREPGRLHD